MGLSIIILSRVSTLYVKTKSKVLGVWNSLNLVGSWIY